MTALQAEEIGEALLLARIGQRPPVENGWREEFEALLNDPGRGGVLIARDTFGRACGLLTYRIAVAAEALPSLEVLRLVAFDLLHPRAIADVMITEAVRLARLQHCDRLCLLRPPGRASDTTDLVIASGVAALHSVL
ncbi:MAG: hypothetical protein ACOH1E_03735 [Brevundimonas sp.]